MKPAATIGIIIGIIIVIVVSLIAYSYTQIQISLESVSYRGLDFASPSGSTILKLAADFITGNWLGLALTLVTGVKLGLVFGLSNHGFFPVYIPDVSYDILVNGVKIGQGQSHIDSTINPGQTMSFPENTQDIQFGSIEPAINSIVESGGIANFQVSGTAYFNFLGINVPVPFQQSRQVNIVDEIKNQINSYISQNQQYSQQSYQGNQGYTNSYQQNQQPSYQPPQQTQSVSVFIDKTSYNYGDVITMSGIVFPVVSNQMIKLQLVNPSGQLIAYTLVNPSIVGTYSTSAFRMGASSLPAGTYSIIATYGSGRSQTEFSYGGYPFQSTNPSLQSNPQSNAISITNTVYNVPALTYSYISFNMQCSGRVTGVFSATGTLGNDIIVYILDQSEFSTFQAGQSASTWYNSGKVGYGTFNVGLYSGQYYLVLSNIYSVISPKEVSVEASYTCS